MITFNDFQTQAQITAAIAAATTLTQIAFSVVGQDSSYGPASVNVVIFTSDGNIAGYRTAVASIEAGKLYVQSTIAANSITTTLGPVTVDDGQGIQYTLAQVEAWT